MFITERSGSGRESIWRLNDDGRIAESGVSVTPAAPRTQDCAGMDCYGVARGQLGLEASHDGGRTFTTVWSVSGEAYEQLAKDYHGVRPQSLAVTVRQTAQGHVVFVANGRDGVLYRDPAGTWTRLGMPRGGEGLYFEKPPRLLTDPKPFDPGPVIGAAVMLLVFTIGLVLLAHRRALRTWRLGAAAAVSVITGAMAALISHFPDVGMFPGALYAVFLIVIILIIGLGVVVGIAIRARVA